MEIVFLQISNAFFKRFCLFEYWFEKWFFS